MYPYNGIGLGHPTPQTKTISKLLNSTLHH
jgi:hypothetical protein